MIQPAAPARLEEEYDDHHHHNDAEDPRRADRVQDRPQVQRFRSKRIMEFLELDEEVASIVGLDDDTSLLLHETDSDDSSTMLNYDSRDDLSDGKNIRHQCCSCSWKRFCYFLAAIFTLIVILLSILLIGAAVEAGTVRRAPSTLGLYTDDTSVCANNRTSPNRPDDDTSLVFESFASVNETTETIVHCGSCGQCSNSQDLEIMSATRETLTNDATTCAFKIFLSQSKVETCLEEKVGFTADCNECWVSNIACTFNHCKFTCIKTKMFGSKHNGGDNTDLNECLHCDEVMCGPAFLDCSGANRRRMGIVSDIGRDANQEQCQDVSIDWAAAIPADSRRRVIL
eukprot:CAMPEP_0119019762 /NCGR_PEP_ID=MMETSP1176-20130426/22599_1 /TAXON_ID=265551 /ORGANISM="Synedropsis recta cf, Strain CCMP1620" /LENGTH=341 /DNA_ID=CAMNT_0006974043 /DNA_START=47 /DNA_END=1072 /DNA_ORIENTATION=+